MAGAVEEGTAVEEAGGKVDVDTEEGVREADGMRTMRGLTHRARSPEEDPSGETPRINLIVFPWRASRLKSSV